MVEPVDRKQERAGKNVLLDEIHPAAQGLVAVVRYRDVLQGEKTVGLEQTGTGGGVVGQILVTDGLQHFDGNDLVEPPGDVAVVQQADLDAVREPGGGDALHRQVALLLRNGHGGHAATVFLSSVQAPAAPPRADLEDVVGGLQAQVAAERVVLGDLSLGEGSIGPLPPGGGIHHRFIEPESEEIIRQVVMVGNVAASRGSVVRAQEMPEPVEGPQDVQCEQLRPARARERGCVPMVEYEPADHGCQVGRLPIAVDVRLGEANVTIQKAFLEKGRAEHADRGTVDHARSHLDSDRCSIAEYPGSAVRQLHDEPAER